MSSNVVSIEGENKRRTTSPFLEIGRSGLRRFSGIVQEEFIPSLRGRGAVRIYNEMRFNDANIGGSLGAMEHTIRRPSWFVDPNGDTNLHLKAAKFLSENTRDMSHSWDELISEVTTMLAFGWAWFEVVYKLRKGDVRDPKRKSMFNDGRVGWRKIALRMQSSFSRWEFDDNGGVQALLQEPAPDFQVRRIPINRSLLFRTRIEGSNPEGRSVLRNVYRSWYIKKNIEELEAIGIERDLIGLPIIKPPEGFDIEDAANADTVTAVRSLLYSLRRDEQDGVFLPPDWEIDLLGSGGSSRRQFDLDKTITRWDKRIAIATLTQAIMLGMDRVGSFALSKSSVDSFFLISIQGYLNLIADVFNRFAVPDLFRHNPEFSSLMLDGELPELVPGKVSAPSLTEIGEYVSKLGAHGFIISDDDLKRDLRRLGDFKESPGRKVQVAGSEKLAGETSETQTTSGETPKRTQPDPAREGTEDSSESNQGGT